MASIEMVWDTSGITNGFAGKGIEKAVFRALKKAGSDAIKATRVEGSRYVRSRKRFKVSKANKGLPLVFPHSKEIDGLEWKMLVSGRPSPVIDFPHRQVKAGVRVEINRGHPTLIKSAFIATMKSGHEGVFKRVGKARLPIKELFTTRLSDVFRDEGMVERTFLRTRAVLSATFERVLPMELEKIP